MRFCSPAPAGAPGSFFSGLCRGQALGAQAARPKRAHGAGPRRRARGGGRARGPAAPRPLRNFIPLHPRQRVSVSLPGGAI